MSTLRVEVVEIQEILPHPNADRLEIAQINGWQCVVGKGNYLKGDTAIYIPIDSVLPETLEQKLFPPDSKVKLTNHRVKTIKLRGAISQGMLARLETLGLKGAPVGTDFTTHLGVTKYEPTVSMGRFGVGNAQATRKKATNPNFHRYTEIENIKNYTKVFETGEEVYVTEKIHGTNFRAGYVPYNADTWFKRIARFFGLTPSHEFVYGSHNVQLSNDSLKGEEWKKNVYAETVVRYRLREILKPGEVLYGEVYGGKIQKGYSYGLGPDQRRLVVFDVSVDGRYLDVDDAKQFCFDRELSFVPIVYVGPFDYDRIKQMTTGNSLLSFDQKVREGVVIKPAQEQHCLVGRKILKFISDDYLLKNSDDETEKEGYAH